MQIIDGHSPIEIQQALDTYTAHSQNAAASPLAIVARTIKGWGFSAVLGSQAHGQPVPKADLEKVLAALDAMARQIGAAWTEGDLRIPPLPAAAPRPAGLVRQAPTFGQALRQFGREKALETGQFATRKAYGVALQALRHAHPGIVALDGDVRNSTYAEYFYEDAALRERFFECRIAEQHMISCAGGLAAGGKLPFVSTFGRFVTRGYDQLEMGLISRFPLKVVGSHAGVSLAADGPSQMALPDVAYFRAWATVRTRTGNPVLYLLQPADAYAAYALTVAMAEYDGACYMRTFRTDVPFLYDDATTRFTLGGHQTLEQGHDLLLVTAGYMAHEAKKVVAQAYISALERRAVEGQPVRHVASVASFFLSRIDVLVDQLLTHRIRPEAPHGEGPRAEHLFGKAAVANARRPYQSFKRTFSGERPPALAERGPVCSGRSGLAPAPKIPSMKMCGTSNRSSGRTPSRRCRTRPSTPSDHGVIRENSVEANLEEARQTLRDLEHVGVDLDHVAWQLQNEGAQKFIDPYDASMKTLAAKRQQFLGANASQQTMALGAVRSVVPAAYAALDNRRFGHRLFAHDPWLWTADAQQAEAIRQRLGWLDSLEVFRPQVKDLAAFATGIKEAEYTHVVLLGMGGSSLWADVCRETFGSAQGWPELLVLDNTDHLAPESQGHIAVC